MIPHAEWLDSAKRLAVGMRVRVRHNHERRPNMVIANAPDKWWCYCQACKDGAVVQKDHVVLGSRAVPNEPSLECPQDCVAQLPQEALRFLASKGMDLFYFGGHRCEYSPSYKRIVIDTTFGRMGRDITNMRPAKWLAYDGQVILGRARDSVRAIVVEDTFSWYKVQYAMRGYDVSVLCALGTGVHDVLVLELLKAEDVIFFMDGDDAGYAGAGRGATRMRSMGVPAYALCAPPGKDPKDLSCEEIRNHLGGVL